MSWIMALLALVGTVANIYKLKWCFWLWLVTNGYWTIYDHMIGAYAQSALFFVYFCLAIFGVWKWRKE